MTVYKGNKYVYQFTKDLIYLEPLIDQYRAVSIEARYDEDFSIFDFGPEICKQVEIGTKKVIIDQIGEYYDCILRVSFPNPGINIEILIYDLDRNTIIDITDITNLPNRSNPVDTNERTAEEDNAEFVDNGCV